MLHDCWTLDSLQEDFQGNRNNPEFRKCDVVQFFGMDSRINNVHAYAYIYNLPINFFLLSLLKVLIDIFCGI